MSTRYAIAAALLVGCASTAPTSWREHDDVRAMQGPGSDHVAAPAAVDAQPVLNVVVATKNEPPPSATKVDPTVDPKIIAVLLPLSGPHAAVGREFKAAIELAGDADSKRMYFDTAGDADKAALAVADAEHSGAVAILGPVGQHEAAAAAAAATKLGIPIALLAPADGADPVAGVFRVIESPADEARFAARIAAERSFTTVGVWVPNDDVGNETADAFVAEANALGLTVTSRGSYDPTAKDLQPAVEQLLGLNPETNPRYKTFIARNGRRSKKAFTPDVPFGLLYLPDRYDRSALIASFLPYLGVETRNSDFPDTEMLRRKHNGRVPQIVQLLGGVTYLPSVAASAIFTQGQPSYPGTTGTGPSSQTTTTVLPATAPGAQEDCTSCAVEALVATGLHRSHSGWATIGGARFAVDVAVGPSATDRVVANSVIRQWRAIGVRVHERRTSSEVAASIAAARSQVDAAIFTRPTVTAPAYAARSWSGPAYADSFPGGWRASSVNALYHQAIEQFNPVTAASTWLALDQTIVDSYWVRPLFTEPSLMAWANTVGTVEPTYSIPGLVDQLPTWTTITPVTGS